MVENHLPELYIIQMEEIINGYVVKHGEFGSTVREFVERRVDALDLIVKIAKREYGNEVNKLRHVVSPDPIDIDGLTGGKK